MVGTTDPLVFRSEICFCHLLLDDLKYFHDKIFRRGGLGNLQMTVSTEIDHVILVTSTLFAPRTSLTGLSNRVLRVS